MVCEAEGADWAVLLRGVPAAFVDVYSPQDVYPEELRQQLAAYLANMDPGSGSLPGGRYCCAQALVQRNLPFLAARSLGEICHIVQLAISHKKLLGYHSGMLVPYMRSQSMVKDTSARCQKPCAARNRGSVATWGMLR